MTVFGLYRLQIFLKIKLSIPSTSGVVGAAVLAFFTASCDGAKNVACVDSQTTVLFPLSTAVRPSCAQTCLLVSKKLQLSFLPSGGVDTLWNVIFSGSDRFLTSYSSIVIGSLSSMPLICKVETTEKGHATNGFHDRSALRAEGQILSDAKLRTSLNQTRSLHRLSTYPIPPQPIRWPLE